MKTVYTIMLAMLFAVTANAQILTNTIESTPYIQVTGEAEKEVIPDEIYLHFTLQEFYDGRDKVELDDLEKDLFRLMERADFDLENLSLADANADYITIKRKKMDVLASKEYEMKLSTSGEIADLLDVLDEVQVQNAYVSRTDHSQREELKKEVKIMAMKNAKEKATYLLEAVGEEVGQALVIQEQGSYVTPVNTARMMTSAVSYVDDEMAKAVPEISFQKITLNYRVSARFAIEP